MLISLCEESPDDLMSVLGPFFSHFASMIFVKSNSTIIAVLMRQREKSQTARCFGFNKNLIHSNL